MGKFGRSWFSRFLVIVFAFVGSVPAIAQWSPNVGKGMSPLDVLVAEDQIRQKYSLYTLMLDGDNLTPVKDSKAWAEALFTKDAVFQSIGPEGQLRRGPHGVVGREAIEKAFGPTGTSGSRPRNPNAPVTAGRHFPIDIVFDELTPTTAKTRATAMLLATVVRADNPLAYQQHISFTVYHDTWRKEADGQWRKSQTLNYFSTCSGAECQVSPEELAASAVRTR